MDVLHERRAGGGAIRLPELATTRAIASLEVERTVEGREPRGGGAACRVDVPHERRAGGGAVRLPELVVTHVLEEHRRGAMNDDAVDARAAHGAGPARHLAALQA